MKFRTCFFIGLLITGFFGYNSFGQNSPIIKELNWLNKSGFDKILISKSEVSKFDGVAIYANELSLKEVDSIYYTASENTTKNVYIFANKINFGGFLSFNLPGEPDTLGLENPKRNGGNLIIYAREVAFNNFQVLDINSPAEFSRYPLTLGFNNRVNKAGGAHGRLYLIFEKIDIDENNLINVTVNQVTQLLSDQANLFTHLIEQDTTIKIAEFKQGLLKEFDDNVGSLFAKDMIAKYPKIVDTASFSKKLNDAKTKLNNVKYYSEGLKLYNSLVKDILFDYIIKFTKALLSASKDFNDLNKGKASEFSKLSKVFNLYGDPYAKDSNIPIASNLFVSFNTKTGKDIVDGNIIRSKGHEGDRLSNFKFYNNLGDFISENPEFEDWPAKWLVAFLKDIQFKIRKAKKNNDNKGLLNTIALYNQLPDINVNDEILRDSYSNLLKDINDVRDSYNFKILPLKNNVVEEIRNGSIMFYCLPSMSLTENFSQEKIDKLGILKVLLSQTNQNKQIDFHAKLSVTGLDVQNATEASSGKGNYSGIYNDWSIDKFEFLVDGINRDRSTIVKEGNLVDLHIEFLDDDKIPLALLFGYGNFIVKLTCHSNYDKDFNFEIDLPVNFRYRFTNYIKVLGNSITNDGNNDVTIYGYISTDNQWEKFETPLVLNSKQTIKVTEKIKSLPSELIENRTYTEFRDNYTNFINVTEGRELYQDLLVYNNFALTSKEGNRFDRLELNIQYNDGTQTKTIQVISRNPHEEQTFKIPYPSNNPNFKIWGNAYYENEILAIPEKIAKNFHITVDENTIKK